MKRATNRALVGAVTVLAILGVVAVSIGLFRDDFAESVPVTVLSPRAGLVMNPDAKVQIHGVQIGRVQSIDQLPDGTAALHLEIEPDRVGIVPANVTADISSTTVFGGKVVRLVPPPDPSSESIHAGQVLDADHVMIEANTLFEQLVTTLSAIQPEKLNETLGALAAATRGRGDAIGAALVDLDAALGQINPHLGALSRDLSLAPTVFGALADAAPDLLSIADRSAAVSRTVVNRQDDLDALLVSAIGLAGIGTPVLEQNRQPLADTLRLLEPTTSLADEYRQALTCGLGSLLVMSNNRPLVKPGVEVLAGFFWGQERYRYPADLPKVAAAGGPQCADLPKVPYGKAPAFVVADTGANPWKYGNTGLMVNSDLLKQIMFGTIDGPPRNSAQIGQPG